MKTLTKIFLFSGAMTSLLMGLAQSPAQAGEDCKQLVVNKCGTCHFVKYICPKIENGKGTLGWMWVIKDMVNVGMKVTDQEKDRLTNCLANPDQQVKSLCPATK